MSWVVGLELKSGVFRLFVYIVSFSLVCLFYCVFQGGRGGGGRGWRGHNTWTWSDTSEGKTNLGWNHPGFGLGIFSFGCVGWLGGAGLRVGSLFVCFSFFWGGLGGFGGFGGEESQPFVFERNSSLQRLPRTSRGSLSALGFRRWVWHVNAVQNIAGPKACPSNLLAF